MPPERCRPSPNPPRSPACPLTEARGFSTLVFHYPFPGSCRTVISLSATGLWLVTPPPNNSAGAKLRKSRCPGELLLGSQRVASPPGLQGEMGRAEWGRPCLGREPPHPAAEPAPLKARETQMLS